MAQAVSRRPVTAEAGVRSRVVHVGHVVDKVALGQVFIPVFRFSPVTLLHRCSITRKNKKEKLIICITMLHNMPQGCGASVASAAGPFSTQKETSPISLQP
jgi:hypothetical protein